MRRMLPLTSMTISPALLMDSTALPSAVKAHPAAIPACRRRPHCGCSAPPPADHMRICGKAVADRPWPGTDCAQRMLPIHMSWPVAIMACLARATLDSPAAHAAAPRVAALRKRMCVPLTAPSLQLPASRPPLPGRCRKENT